MVLTDICKELARNGVKKFVIYTSHGGNVYVLWNFLRVAREQGIDKNMDIYFLPPLNLASKKIEEVKETKYTTHACEIETSLSLYLLPEKVRRDRIDKAEAHWTSKHELESVRNRELITLVDWRKYMTIGALGDPRKASEEKGKAIVDEMVAKFCGVLEELLKNAA